MLRHSFMAAGQAQLDLLARSLQRAEEKGYFALVHGQNKDARNSRYLYNYFAGGLSAWIKDWGLAHGRRCVTINVFPKNALAPAQDPLHFNFKLPRRAAFKPIKVALGLMAEHKDTRHSNPKGAAALTCFTATDYWEFRGSGRAALEIVVSILEMPHHREILTRTFRHKSEE